jgi:predicted RNase H-like HicB family nuclease
MMNDNATMQQPVLVEALVGRPGYVARLGEPFNLAAEAESPEDALRQLSEAVRKLLQAGARILPLALPLTFPSPSQAGWLPDDELTSEWRDAIEQYRRECDVADRSRILGESKDDDVSS